MILDFLKRTPIRLSRKKANDSAPPPISRKGDAVIYVEQDNDRKTLTIVSIVDEKKVLVDSLQTNEEALEKAPLQQWLPERINENLVDYLDYDDLGNDLVAVLQRTRDFALKTKSGQEVRFNIRVQRDVIVDKNMRYAIVMTDPMEEKRTYPEELTSLLATLNKDPGTSVYGAPAMEKIFDCVEELAKEEKINATFMFMRLCQYDKLMKKHGPSEAKEIVNEVIASCVLTFRNEDILSYIGDSDIGVILVGSSVDQVVHPLNRLRWNIRRMPYFSMPNDKLGEVIQVGCMEMDGVDSYFKAIELCENAIKSGDNKALYHQPKT